MNEPIMPVTVVHNLAEARFEADLGAGVAVAEYERVGTALYFTHTETPVAYRGRGIAAQVVKAGLDYAQANGLTVVPFCPFVAGYLAEHPEYQALVREP